MAKKRAVKKTVKKAVKKGGYGLFGKAARGLMSRKSRVERAVSGKKRKR